MTVDDPLTLQLKQLLADVARSRRMFAAERAYFKWIARRRNMRHTIDGMTIEAQCKSLETQLAADGPGTRTA
jgi:hypothetical protein